MDEKVAKLVKQAAFRSLSCELVPDKEGEMYFGDESRGHVLSHTFFLKDSRGRGFQRWFSILVFMRDKHYLIKSWHFIHTQLNQLVNQLQSRAAKVCASEQPRCSQRAGAGRRTEPPCGSSVARSLAVLTDTPQIYAQIHLWFSWLLSACSQRLTDASSYTMPLNCQIQQTTEDGFVVIEKQADGAVSEVFPGIHDGSTMESLEQLCQHMGVRKFTSLLTAVVCGRQLVVRGSHRLVYYLFHLLKVFVPDKIGDGMEYQDEYSKSPAVVGVPFDAAVPVASPSVLRLDIIQHAVNGDLDGRLELNQYEYILKECSSSIDDVTPAMVVKSISYITNPAMSHQLTCTLIVNLVAKWKHNADMWNEARKRCASHDLSPLLISFGAQQHDQQLLQYWSP